MTSYGEGMSESSRRRALLRVITSVGVVLATALGMGGLGGLSPASAASVIDQQAPLGPGGGGQSAWFGSGQTQTQPFTARVSGPLTAVSVSIGTMRTSTNVNASGNSNFTIGIWAMLNGRPVGPALAEKTFGPADVDALGFERTPTTVMATFASPPTVVAGTTYAVVVSSTDQYPAYHWFVGSYCEFPYGYYGDARTSPVSWSTWPYASTFMTYVDGTPSSGGGGPDAPSAVSASVGDASTDVSFSLCSTGGQTITNYEYRLDGAGAWTAFSPARTTSPVTVTGLTNGTPVSIELRAVYSGGVGPASSPVSVTPMAPPGAPTAVTATPGDQQATVTFTPPASDGGSAIQYYEYELDGTGAWTAFSPSTASSPGVITGLVNGTPVAVSVRAVSGYSAGAGSAPVTVTPNPPAPAQGGGASGGGAGSSPEPAATTSPQVTAPTALMPLTVPSRIAAGEGLVLIDGRSVPIAVQASGSRTWRVAGEGFSMEFTVQAPAGGRDGRFTARAGSLIDVSGDGYQPGTLVATYLPGVLAESLGQERVRSDGTFTVRARFPQLTGQYVFQVNGLATPTSVRSVNLGLTLVEAPAAVNEASWSTRISFLRGSALLTSSARKTLASFMRGHWTNASTATIVPVVRPQATAAERALAKRRAVAVVTAMRAYGKTTAPRIARASIVDARRAQQVTAVIQR